MAGDFSTLTGISDSGYAASSTNPDALGLTNPDSVLSGTNRGIQNLGSPSLYADGGNNRIVAAPNQVPSVLMGNQPTFGNGFYVAKSGVNVITNTDASQFIFNSNQNVFKIVKTGTYTFPSVAVGAGASVYQTTSIVHGLTTVPKIQVDGIRDSSRFGADETAIFPSSIYIPLSYRQILDITSNITSTVLFGADATNIYIGLTQFNGTGGSLSTNTYTVRYYAIQETAATT